MNLKFRKDALAARICLVLLTGGVPQILSASEAMEVVQQSSAINGVVVDEAGEPIIGANILQKGTTNGPIPDFDGKFSLNVPAQATITVTYIGYKTQKLEIGDRTVFDIKMVEDNVLDAVEIVAKQVTRSSGLDILEREMTHATQKVSMDDMEESAK